jgi:L-iditol 2-dehydrogenase
MKAAVYYNNKDIRVVEMEKPTIGPDEALVKIFASGVCGSDVLEWYRVPKAPLVLGHEIAGDLVEIGAAVQGWNIGDRVFASHHVPCNMCRWCLSDHHSVCDTLKSTNFHPGGFCEYVRLPAVNVRNGLYRLPESMSYDEAVFIEPLACVFRGQHNAGWSPARRVLVIGSGMAGLLHIQLARVMGASRIFAVDITPARLEAALKFCADVALPAGPDLVDRLKESNEGRLAELVIVCAGAQGALDQVFYLVDRGGTVLFFAPSDPNTMVSMPFNHVWWQELKITSSYAGSPRDIRAAMELIATGRINVKDMITHKFPLDRTVDAFGLVAKADESIKVVIEPQQ